MQVWIWCDDEKCKFHVNGFCNSEDIHMDNHKCITYEEKQGDPISHDMREIMDGEPE